MQNFNEKCSDANVEKNIELLRARSRRGVKKYSTTTDMAGLDHIEWLQHALEEALDMANYLQAAISSRNQHSATAIDAAVIAACAMAGGATTADRTAAALGMSRAAALLAIDRCASKGLLSCAAIEGVGIAAMIKQ